MGAAVPFAGVEEEEAEDDIEAEAGGMCVRVCVAVCCRLLQCVAVCYSVLQYVAVCCGVLQCVTVCCSCRRCGR